MHLSFVEFAEYCRTKDGESLAEIWRWIDDSKLLEKTHLKVISLFFSAPKIELSDFIVNPAVNNFAGNKLSEFFSTALEDSTWMYDLAGRKYPSLSDLLDFASLVPEDVRSSVISSLSDRLFTKKNIQTIIQDEICLPDWLKDSLFERLESPSYIVDEDESLGGWGNRYESLNRLMEVNVFPKGKKDDFVEAEEWYNSSIGYLDKKLADSLKSDFSIAEKGWGIWIPHGLGWIK